MTTKNIQDVVAERVDKFTTELMHRARYVQGNQYPEDSEEYKAYQAGFESALAMVYIDLTGTPKTVGMLTQLVKEVEAKAHQAGRDEEVGKCNYLKIVTHRVFIHPDDEKKNIPPVFEANVELQNVDTNRITYPTVLFKYDTIKPLQDNK